MDHGTPPLREDETVYGLIGALLDPETRALVNARPQGAVELHWNAEKNEVTLVTRTTVRRRRPLNGRVHIAPPTLHSG